MGNTRLAIFFTQRYRMIPVKPQPRRRVGPERRYILDHTFTDTRIMLRNLWSLIGRAWRN
jgi:hypothetical protein